MDRHALAELLVYPGEADAACRAAILAGGDFEIWNGAVPVDHLVRVYRRRERLNRSERIPSLGFTDAVSRLESCALTDVLLGYARSARRDYHFHLFLAPDAAQIVACLGVSQSTDQDG
ncbi:hypothetical protein Ssi03_69890 [Sphaerisporangium siamense]|uniref:Uncharacterized protein n=1 Tax=Sphaerisporangium siamense TaxID=795645 RepID=A0A7W7DB64_9ACTN|nr:hypothetical protein [Sphaerisporangium siamense]MBB4702366.1 hypothetical protein [Sphaerisporangium siamense]GII88999.1 hypothetical protein Ssi03_69890 [Sphaerisporangium siamense]